MKLVWSKGVSLVLVLDTEVSHVGDDVGPQTPSDKSPAVVPRQRGGANSYDFEIFLNSELQVFKVKR